MRSLQFFFLIFFCQTVFSSDFSSYEKILKANIEIKNQSTGGFESSFNYQKAHDHSDTLKQLQRQKEVLKKFSIDQLKSKDAANAFWINAYNFFMIATILEKGFKNQKLNINSVKDFGSFFSPYKIFQLPVHTIGSKNYSLDEIEKKILLGEDFKLKGWKDARIHFAVNCASVGCPPLRETIYTEENIDSLLNENIKKALKTPRHFYIKNEQINVTHLFKWYEKDFQEHSGSIKKFLERYMDDPTLVKKLNESQKLDYIDYNWNLNKPENF